MPRSKAKIGNATQNRENKKGQQRNESATVLQILEAFTPK